MLKTTISSSQSLTERVFPRRAFLRDRRSVRFPKNLVRFPKIKTQTV